MASGEQAHPQIGDVISGYAYTGGDPNRQESWQATGGRESAAQPSLPKVNMQPSFLGRVYGLGSSAAKAAPALLPVAAAIGAGAADPLAAPVTAPLAYAATEGLVSPKDIQQHPVREGLTAASMAIPGPAEAMSYAFPRFAVEHPAMMRLGGAALGGAVGAGLGERSGGGRYGELGGGVGGAFIGYGLGGREAAAQGEKLIQDVLEGSRPLNELPERLLPQYMRQSRALADAYAQMALEKGEKPEMIKIPTGLRNQVQNIYEERSRMSPQMPRVIMTPEEFAQKEGEASYLGAQREAMRPSASARGMAHAAGQHESEWVPSKRGQISTVSQTFRLRGKRP